MFMKGIPHSKNKSLSVSTFETHVRVKVCAKFAEELFDHTLKCSLVVNWSFTIVRSVR